MITFGTTPATSWADFVVYAAAVVAAFVVIEIALIYTSFAVRRWIGRRRHRAHVRRIVADHEARVAAIHAAWGHR